MNNIIKLLKHIVNKYELKHPTYTDPIFICKSLEHRNRCRNEMYQIPLDHFQCPVFKDNRCCGACHLAPECDYCVGCNCYGWAYAQMGGNDKNYYLHKGSPFYFGRIKNGKFDWDYYKKKDNQRKIKPGKYLIYNHFIYEIKSKLKRNGTFQAYNYIKKIYEKLSIEQVLTEDMISSVTVYDKYPERIYNLFHKEYIEEEV